MAPKQRRKEIRVAVPCSETPAGYRESRAGTPDLRRLESPLSRLISGSLSPPGGPPTALHVHRPGFLMAQAQLWMALRPKTGNHYH